MTDMEILKLKVKLDNSILDKEQKEDFYTMIHQNRDVFSMQDKIGTSLSLSTLSLSTLNKFCCFRLINRTGEL